MTCGNSLLICKPLPCNPFHNAIIPHTTTATTNVLKTLILVERGIFCTHERRRGCSNDAPCTGAPALFSPSWFSISAEAPLRRLTQPTLPTRTLPTPQLSSP